MPTLQNARVAIRSRIPSGWPEQLFIRTWRMARTCAGQELLTTRDVRLKDVLVGDVNCQFNIVPELLSAKSTVYCAGIGTNISFDLALIERFGLDVHAFDPTPKTLAWLSTQSLPGGFHAHPYGLADRDGNLKFAELGSDDCYTVVGPAGSENSIFMPARTLGSVMAELGHKSLDLLKLDIEGAEFGVIEEIVREKIPISQLCVEFHHRLPEIGVKPTRTAVKALRSAGFQVFRVSATGAEYSFIGPSGRDASTKP
jgi:FkbM family methyltransferase